MSCHVRMHTTTSSTLEIQQAAPRQHSKADDSLPCRNVSCHHVSYAYGHRTGKDRACALRPPGATPILL
eukprot:scaffold194310_cov31-Tisochrysis_lutea.AAC.1